MLFVLSAVGMFFSQALDGAFSLHPEENASSVCERRPGFEDGKRQKRRTVWSKRTKRHV